MGWATLWAILRGLVGDFIKKKHLVTELILNPLKISTQLRVLRFMYSP
jgi:hypothetical protein